MPHPADTFVEAVLPLSGSVEARDIQTLARVWLRDAVANLLAGQLDPPTFDAVVAALLALRQEPAIPHLVGLQIELALAPHRRPAQATAWAAIAARSVWTSKRQISLASCNAPRTLA